MGETLARRADGCGPPKPGSGSVNLAASFAVLRGTMGEVQVGLAKQRHETGVSFIPMHHGDPGCDGKAQRIIRWLGSRTPAKDAISDDRLPQLAFHCGRDTIPTGVEQGYTASRSEKEAGEPFWNEAPPSGLECRRRRNAGIGQSGDDTGQKSVRRQVQIPVKR